MRLLVVLGCVLSLCLPAFADEFMSISAFRDEMLKRFEVAYPELRFERSDDAAIKFEGDGKEYGNGQIFVDNSYQLYRDAPEDMSDIMDRMIASLGAHALGSPEDDMPDDEFLSHLVLLLRPISYGTDIPNMPVNFLKRPFVGDLSQLVAYDSPETLRFVTKEELETRELSEDEVFRFAASNIMQRAGQIAEEAYGGLTMIATENGLATGLPLVPDACTPDTEDHAYWIVDRETLLRSSLEDGIEGPDMYELGITVIGALENGYGMSAAIMTCIDGEWDAAYMSPGAN